MSLINNFAYSMFSFANPTKNHSTYAQIAEASYDFSAQNKVVGNAIRNDKYTTSKDNGFQGCVYEMGDTVIVAYRGSDQGSLRDCQFDWKSNSQMMNGEIPEQYEDAMELYNRVSQDYEGTGKKIVVTGHSLGGSLAELVSATSALGDNAPQAITFNSYGTMPIVYNANSIFTTTPNNVNYYIETDEHVGAARPHNGMEISMFSSDENPDPGRIGYGIFSISGTEAHKISHFTNLNQFNFIEAYTMRNSSFTTDHRITRK